MKNKNDDQSMLSWNPNLNLNDEKKEIDQWGDLLLKKYKGKKKAPKVLEIVTIAFIANKCSNSDKAGSKDLTYEFKNFVKICR